MHKFVLLLTSLVVLTRYQLQRPITAISRAFSAPTQENLRLEVDIMVHSLDLLVLFQTIRSQLPSNTTLLEPTKWNTIMSHHVVITPYRSRVHCSSDSQCLGVILSEYSCAQTVYCRVCKSDCFFFSLEFACCDYRSKDLGLVHSQSNVVQSRDEKGVPLPGQLA
jgi:hypothetical protein